jgi:hypothetical protein
VAGRGSERRRGGPSSTRVSSELGRVSSKLDLRPSILSTALYPLYDPLFPQQPSVLSTALCLLYSSFPLYDHLSPLGPSVLSTALCLLYSPLSPLWPSVPSTALCPLYGPLSPLRPSVPSTALCPLRPSVPSKTQRNKRKDPLVSQNVLQKAFLQNSKGYRDLFRVSDNRDYRDNHDYHSNEMLSDNREIAIIALAKKVAIIAIITSNMK